MNNDIVIRSRFIDIILFMLGVMSSLLVGGKIFNGLDITWFWALAPILAPILAPFAFLGMFLSFIGIGLGILLILTICWIFIEAVGEWWRDR